MKILVLSATASAINYIKALSGRPDLELLVSDASRFASGLYYPGVTPLVIPPARRLEAYHAALQAIIEQHGVQVLIPTSDHDMAGVMELLHRGWDPPVHMFRPDFQTYRLLADKGALNQRMLELGFAAPRLYRKPPQRGYPLVVKPAREGGGKGVFVVGGRRELEARCRSVGRAYGQDLVLQEYIPGGLGSIYVALLLYGPDGLLYGQAASNSSLTYLTWGGGGNAGGLVDEPELLDQARQIIQALGGWQGPVNLEFKRHAGNGRFYLMEANCRLNGYSYLTTMNQMNFPAAVVDLLTRGTTEPLIPAEQRRNFILGFRERLVEQWAPLPQAGDQPAAKGRSNRLAEPRWKRPWAASGGLDPASAQAQWGGEDLLSTQDLKYGGRP